MGDRITTKLYILTDRKQESIKAEILIIIISGFFNVCVVSFGLTLYNPDTLKLTPKIGPSLALESSFLTYDLRII